MLGSLWLRWTYLILTTRCRFSIRDIRPLDTPFDATMVFLIWKLKTLLPGRKYWEAHRNDNRLLWLSIYGIVCGISQVDNTSFITGSRIVNDVRDAYGWIRSYKAEIEMTKNQPGIVLISPSFYLDQKSNSKRDHCGEMIILFQRVGAASQIQLNKQGTLAHLSKAV